MILYYSRSPTTSLTAVYFPFTFAPHPPPDPLRACTIFWLVILIQFDLRLIHLCLLYPRQTSEIYW